jgi:hypothetical protein
MHCLTFPSSNPHPSSSHVPPLCLLQLDTVRKQYEDLCASTAGSTAASTPVDSIGTASDPSSTDTRATKSRGLPQGPDVPQGLGLADFQALQRKIQELQEQLDRARAGGSFTESGSTPETSTTLPTVPQSPTTTDRGGDELFTGLSGPLFGESGRRGPGGKPGSQQVRCGWV